MEDNEPQTKVERPATQDAQRPTAPLKRKSSDRTEEPKEAQKTGQTNRSVEQDDEDVQGNEEDETEDENEPSVPADSINDFNWKDLHERYHEAMEICRKEESTLLKEWFDLMNYFQAWADSGHDQETDRSFKRLKTRTAYVQHSEEKLERTRSHYVEVVKAFESALDLLKAHGFGS